MMFGCDTKDPRLLGNTGHAIAQASAGLTHHAPFEQADGLSARQVFLLGLPGELLGSASLAKLGIDDQEIELFAQRVDGRRRR